MAMYVDIFRLFLKNFSLLLRMVARFPIQAYKTKQHLKTYQTLPPGSCKNVVIIGGSFSGIHVAKLLSQSLPTGYRVILIEPSSHFNFTFNFPRYSVLEGKEHKAFIPFDKYFSTAPEGIYERVIGEVKVVREGEVELLSGDVVAYEFLAVATGAKQSPPAKLVGRNKRDASEELRVLQRKIREANTIALVGGGAVGVQLAGDIKTLLPEKRVVLVHSRDQLLPNFGVKLHDYVIEKLKVMGVEVVLEERPVLPETTTTWEPTTLEFKNGKKEQFDLVIPCTGQTPNSFILSNFAPDSISRETGRILVHTTLQLKSDLKETSPKLERIYAVGDVAEANAPRMARAGMMQAEIVRDNILIQISEQKKPLKNYKSIVGMEGILKLSLGKDANVTYVPDESNGGYLFPGKSTNLDLDVDRAWPYFGADLSTAANLDI